jgi:hypothetical protein
VKKALTVGASFLAELAAGWGVEFAVVVVRLLLGSGRTIRAVRDGSDSLLTTAQTINTHNHQLFHNNV